MNRTEVEVSKVSHQYPKRRSDDHDKHWKFCCQMHPMKKTSCPAWGKTCNMCKKPNHFASSDVCDSKVDGKYGRKYEAKAHQARPQRKGHRFPKKKVHAVSVNDESSDGSTEGSVSVVIGDVSVLSDPLAKPIYCKMKIDGSDVVHQI